ncbi:DUF998 domain-containing protein [Kitasatospora sp. NPDC098652]|uniref:DUF998 domain-containing protein n=1 Tax=Kitasatospora sp. NPDC098652 TaxID=3364095 RepID=UPI00381763C4
MTRTRNALIWGGIAAQLLFTVSWLVGGLVEGRGYRVSADTISDLGALTASHPGWKLAAQGIAGLLTIAFALFALRPALAVPGGPRPVAAWLVAASPVGLDNVADVLFRLDCRAADPWCAHRLTGDSWHASAHVGLALAGFVLLVITPAVLAAQFRAHPAWRGSANAALAYSPVMFLGVLVYVGLHGRDGAGYAERALALAASTGVVLLALRASRLTGQELDRLDRGAPRTGKPPYTTALADATAPSGEREAPGNREQRGAS